MAAAVPVITFMFQAEGRGRLTRDLPTKSVTFSENISKTSIQQFIPSFHWSEVSHIATLTWKGDWEI